MKRQRASTIKRVVVVLTLSSLVCLVAVLGCGSVPNPWEGKGGPPRVVVSFPPLTSFVNAVGGERVGVMTLCTTTGPHDYQFNIQDTIKLKEADLFVVNGLGLDDHFADKLKTNTSNGRLRLSKLAEELAEDARIKNPNYVPGKKHEHKPGEPCDGAHGPFDPHAWLGLPQAMAMVRQVGEDLAGADPAHAAEYRGRAKDYIERLDKLHAEGKQKLKGLKAPVITSHAAMSYFAKNFELNVIGSVRGLDGQDSGGKGLARLLEQCKGHERVVITIEPQYSPKSAETLESELTKHGKKVIIVTLDSLETCGEDDDLTGDWYVDRMRANIDALAKHAK